MTATAMEHREPSTLTRFFLWLWRDGPVWIVVASMLFLIVVNLRIVWGGK